MNLELLWLAICIVESHCNLLAVGDFNKAFGIAQIHAGVVIDYNSTHNTTWKHEDCFNVDVSKMMFKNYMSRYCIARRLGHAPTMEDGARIFNGGPNGYKKKSTEKYWIKIEKAFEEIKERG